MKKKLHPDEKARRREWRDIAHAQLRAPVAHHLSRTQRNELKAEEVAKAPVPSAPAFYRSFMASMFAMAVLEDTSKK
jgi:hypothetical protein